MLQIKGHCSYFGNTGYNIYSRGFFLALKKLYPKLSIRSFTSPENSKLTEEDESIVDEITYYLSDENRFVEKPTFSNIKPVKGDINIVLNETNHHYFYNEYEGIKIAYNLWETSRQPLNFFDRLEQFDQIWVPSLWQKDSLTDQGMSNDKVHLVPGGVDIDFIPEKNKLKSDVVKFLIVGSWSFRKSTKEMIERFLKIFEKIENVELLISVDNPYNKDGLKTTEKRLEYYGLESSKIKIIHTLDRESYIKLIKSIDVFLSCSRGEGWNLPLIEALSCGIPSIFSKCCSHLEYDQNYPLTVDVMEIIPAKNEIEKINFTGNYCEPNWTMFETKLLEIYNNLDFYSQVYLDKSSIIREKFSWENSAKIALNLILPLVFKSKIPPNQFHVTPTETEILTPNGTGINNFVYKEIFEYKVYTNIPEMEIKRGDVVLDVGAHIGIFSRYAAENGASRVIAIEMDPFHFSCLKLNVRHQDDVFNCVLLDKVFNRFKLDNDVLVTGFNLDYFYQGGLFTKIDFMKVDISGKELTLLKSISREVYDVISKISVKTYNLNEDQKKLLVEFFKQNGFEGYFNIIIPDQPVQFLYFWK